MTLWWALAVVERAPAVLPSCTFEPGRIDVLEVDGLALIAAALEEAPAVDASSLMRHDAMVRALAASVPSVLPVRFGSQASAADVLLDRLRGHEARLRDGLELVRSAAQITLRSRRGPPLITEPEAEAGELGPGARFLRRRARERAPHPAGWLEEAAELRALTRAERFERGDPRIEQWRGYHLVAHAALAAHHDAGVALRERRPEWELVLGEPSPPYAFAAEVLS